MQFEGYFGAHSEFKSRLGYIVKEKEREREGEETRGGRYSKSIMVTLACQPSP